MVVKEMLLQIFIIKGLTGVLLVPMVSIAKFLLQSINNVQYFLTATLYGDGAYFAVNASYSAQRTYSPPDAYGYRSMFYARVLTGEYTQGQQGLKVPPAKDPSKSLVILYDSVVDDVYAPNMYVVFSDAQCYPEFLITFK